MSDEQTPDVVQAREEEDDHDLLTYGEVGARLSEEIAGQQALVARLEGEGAPAEQLEAARRRLALLRDAAGRNARQPITAENFERFFGYSGTPRRNT